MCVCLASSVLLFRAPQVPFSSHYNGMDYTRYPSLLLVVTGLLSFFCFILGCCGLYWDSKTSLILVRWRTTAGLCREHCSHQSL